MHPERRRNIGNSLLKVTCAYTCMHSTCREVRKGKLDNRKDMYNLDAKEGLLKWIELENT